MGLAHHDMSLENMMRDGRGGLVVIDWGMVVKVPVTDQGVPVKLASSATWPCRCGKLLYLAPELLVAAEGGAAFDPFKLDIWALGLMLFILLTGVPPWGVDTGPLLGDQRFEYVAGGRVGDLLQAWGIVLSPAAVQLLTALFAREPADRPTIAQIRASAWFQRGGR